MYRLKCLTHLTAALRPRYHVGVMRHATKTADDTTNDRVRDKVDKGQKNPDKMKPKITLLAPDSITMIVTLEEAQKMSKRREMKLIKVANIDTKTQRPTYRLMTNAEFKEELKSHVGSESDEKSDKREIKGEKLLQISNKIGDHDLQSRIKNLIKWLSKNYRVVAVISGGNADSAASEKVFHKIEMQTKSLGKIVQKRTKGSDVRFQLHPIPPSEEEKDNKAGKVS